MNNNPILECMRNDPDIVFIGQTHSDGLPYSPIITMNEARAEELIKIMSYLEKTSNQS